MADDSVPLPFPNLKVPQWHFQMDKIERLRENASTSFWKAVEEDGTWRVVLAVSCSLSSSEMAPYLRSINSTNTDLLGKLDAKNSKELSSIEEKLRDAEQSLGESEISELLRSKAMYLCRIGDKVRVYLIVRALD